MKQIEADKLRFRHRPSPIPTERKKTKKEGKSLVTNRFLDGNTHFIAGVTAVGSGNLKLARKEFETATKLVPEDTVAWRELFNVLSKLGQPKEAAKAQNMITTHGLCY